MLIPNYIAKTKNGRETFVGNEIDDCKDFSGLFYNLSFHKGILVNWDTQRAVWNQIIKKQNVDPSTSQIIITEPIFNFSYTQECLEEVFFEEYGFEGFVRTTAPTLAAYKYMKDNSNDFCLVVDSGYSFTHIAPFYKGKIILEGIRRINVGGKHLTNYLKEIISYRQLMVMDETYVINQVKEEVCYASTDFDNDMRIAKLKNKENTIVRDYVLPDYANIRKGYVKSQEESTGKAVNSEQLIRLNNERFCVPELLFNPSDIGMKEMGISEAIVDSVEACFKDVRASLYKNILLMGGNAMFNGFKERVFNDVRSLILDEYELNVQLAENVFDYAWKGGSALANSSEFDQIVVSKKLYEEHGHNICKEKFNIY